MRLKYISDESKMVKRCCYGTCKSNTRYLDREECVIEFFPFPKPLSDLEKCQRWIRLCGRPHEQLNLKILRELSKAKHIYHFVDGKPTRENPDPPPASRYETVTPARRPPKPRANSEPPKKKVRTALSDTFRYSQNEQEDVVTVHPTALTCLPTQDEQYQGDGTNSPTVQLNKENNPLEMLALAAENERLKNHISGLILQTVDLKRKVADAEHKTSEIYEANKRPQLMSAIKIRENEKKDEFIYYTGLKAEQFKALYDFLVPQENPFKMSKKIKSIEKLTMEDQLLLVLMKLCQNFDFAHLGNLFGLSQQDASSLFKNWIQYMFHRCGSVSIWPHRDTIISEMPPLFREEFPNTLVIIDGTEIKIQGPSSMTSQSQCYSDYKSSNTLKGLVGIDPRGSIIFASMLFSGAISDKEITHRSGFLSLLEKLKACGKVKEGDSIMVDKGFHISEEIENLGLKLNIPPFARSGTQKSKTDVKLTEKIARHRVHVERAISRVKNFKILSQKVDLTLFTCINQIWFVSCFVTNFMGYLIKK